MVAVAKRGPVSLSGPHFWIRVAKCFGQRRIQIWKLSQVWAATHCCATVILCRFGHDIRMVERFGLNWCSSVLKNEKLTLSMSYVGVRFLVGSVESSGSAEEEGEG